MIVDDRKKSQKWSVFKSGLSKTREGFLSGLGSLILGGKELDGDVLKKLEASLLEADVGVEITSEIIEELTEKVNRKDLSDFRSLISKLRELLINRLRPLEGKLELTQAPTQLVIFVGVNGAGKTTTIGKLASRFSEKGFKLLLAAGDTFRAAASEQLEQWAQQSDVFSVGQQRGSDSASVIYDAFQTARKKNLDLLLVDTAGRLQANLQLMNELAKIKKVVSKIDTQAPHEIILVIDATVGQNSINQFTSFHGSLGLTGLVLTKLDGTAKGGFLFPLAKAVERSGLKCLPIYYVGLGEKTSDLFEFDVEIFVDALLDFDE